MPCCFIIGRNNIAALRQRSMHGQVYLTRAPSDRGVIDTHIYIDNTYIFKHIGQLIARLNATRLHS